VITPFLRVRGDIASLEAQNAPGMANYIPTGQTEPARFMPAAGVEYRYPFVDVEPWGHADRRADRAAHSAAERDGDREVPQ
jgi:hypothetical protein